MTVLQLSCAAIVALWVALRARLDERPRLFLARLGLLAVAAWAGEDTCIRLYGFYVYDPGWSLYVDRVPLLITLIWPVVIHSAYDLSRALLPSGARGLAGAPLLGGAIVLADASLIEPIAVRAGLWSWSEPGIFSVPPVGILGWAYFAAVCIAVLQRADHGAGLRAWLVVPVAPLATHALLVLTWWGALRWVSGPVPSWPPVVLAWVLSLGLALSAWRAGARSPVPRALLLLRVPAAAFFFVLLALHGRGAPALWAYALAFAPPYLALTARGRPAQGRLLS